VRIEADLLSVIEDYPDSRASRLRHRNPSAIQHNSAYLVFTASLVLPRRYSPHHIAVECFQVTSDRSRCLQ
jgi:hypothetical protein